MYRAPSAAPVRGHRESRKSLVQRELHVAVLAPLLALPVEARLQPVDEPQLEHRGVERAGAGDVVDLLGLAEQLTDLATVVAREVRAHTLAEVRRLADVQGAPTRVAKQVHAGAAGEPIGESQLGGLRVAVDAGEREQVVEAEHAERGGTLEQEVEQIRRSRARRPSAR